MTPDPGMPLPRGCLVLDFDGTILDTEEPLYRSWVEFWDDHGQQMERSDWQRNIGGDDLFDPWTALERRLGRALEPGLQDRRRLRRDEIQAGQPLRDGVLAWLAGAEALGIPVAVASSSSHEWVDGHLDRLGIRHRFTELVCRSEDVPAKPQPTSYRLACEHLGADPACSVAVEDSPNGVAAAVAAGLYTVAVPHPLTRDLDLRLADLVVDSLWSLSVAEAFDRAARRSDRPGPAAQSPTTVTGVSGTAPEA
jgi:HAD superfamily hydrolase (TIGR01509 family)